MYVHLLLFRFPSHLGHTEHWVEFPVLDRKFSLDVSPSIVSQSVNSVTQSCPARCDPMNRSMTGLPVHHQLPEFTQTHVHWVSDAIQPSHLPSSPSPPAPNPSQHQGLFQWVNSSHEVAKVLEFQLQHQSVLPMNTQDWPPLGRTGWISLQSKGLSRVFSNPTVQKHQFFGAQLSPSIVIYISILVSQFISPFLPPFVSRSFCFILFCFFLHLCLYFCLANKFIYNILLDSTYKQYYMIFVFLFLTQIIP